MTTTTRRTFSRGILGSALTAATIGPAREPRQAFRT